MTSGVTSIRHDRVEDLIYQLLREIGEDPDRDGLRDTPHRVAKAMRDMTAGYAEDPSVHLSRTFDEAPDGIVSLPGIEFVSMCEHHMLPFFGTVDIAYLPSDRIVGISKLVRLVDVFAQRLQVQERLGEQIADAMEDHLAPRAIGVRIRARHMCMMARGVRQHRAGMTFQIFRGAFLEDPTAREEALTLFDRRSPQ